MKLKLDLDFCLINSPYSLGDKMILFVTYRGLNRIEDNLCLEEEYENLRYILNKYGFKEIEYCSFESSNNYNLHTEDLKLRLLEHNLRYSKTFEDVISREIDEYHNDIIRMQKIEPTQLVNTNIQDLSNFTKHKIPEIGGKITLYFYLFLQCNFQNENDCALELIEDLYSRQNNNIRNFLHITKSDFVRIESKNPNVVVFQSTKTYGDLLNEINFLHSGNFRFTKPAFNQLGEMIPKSKEFVYNIMEIRKNINPVHRIVVEVNIRKYYDDMLDTSKNIRKEFAMENKRVVPLEALRPEINRLRNKLNEKMLNFAEVDEFEKAGILKKDISFIDNKIKIIDAMDEKNITQQEYYKTFCLNS